MTSKFTLDLNGTVTFRTDKTFRDGDTKATVHELAFDHVCLTFDNIDTVAEAFTEAVMKAMPMNLFGDLPTIDAEVPEDVDFGTKTRVRNPFATDEVNDEATMHLAALKRALVLWDEGQDALSEESEQSKIAQAREVLHNAGLGMMTPTAIKAAIANIEQEGVVPFSARLSKTEA